MLRRVRDSNARNTIRTGLNNRTKAYTALVYSIGAVFLIAALRRWTPSDLLQTGCYLLFALASSNLSVDIRGVSYLSLLDLLVFVSITELGPAQTMAIAAAGILGKCLYAPGLRHKRPRLLFSAMSTMNSAGAAHFVYHSTVLRRLDTSTPVLLLCAAATYFIIHSVTIAIIVSLTERKKVIQAWFDLFFRTSPRYVLSAAFAVLIHGANVRFGWHYSLLAFPAAYGIHTFYKLHLRNREMAALQLRTIEALALAIDADHAGDRKRLRRLQRYAKQVGVRLGLTSDELRALQAAALLRDIGKLAVPEYIVRKPGKLTPEEQEKFRVHPAIGAEILECVNFPYGVVPIVRSHHEKWDGTGYPQGLRRDEIPIGARILAVVECLDELTSESPNHPVFPVQMAIARIAEEAGRSFDPEVVAVLSKCADVFDKAKPSRCSWATSHEPVPATTAKPDQPKAARNGRDGTDFIGSIAAARQEFQLLHEMTRDLGNSLKMDDTLSLLALRLKDLVPHDTIAIYVLANGVLTPRYVSGEEVRLFSSLAIPMGQGLSGWVAASRKAICNGNPSVEAGYLDNPSKFSMLRSAISVPLEGISGVIGALTLYHASPNAFTSDHLRVLLAVSSKAGLTIENAVQFSQAQVSARTDSLTGLPNVKGMFTYLESELVQAKRDGTSLAVLVLDLDGFKKVNDLFGHIEGNKLLQQLANRFQSMSREGDYVARMGGDEFVIVYPGAKSGSLTGRIQELQRITADVGSQCLGQEILGVSIGEAYFPDDGADAEKLIDCADKRMYAVKRDHHRQSPDAGEPEPYTLTLS